MPYLLFCCDNYCPSGGFDDYVDVYETIEAAKASPVIEMYDDAHIVDASTFKIVQRLDWYARKQRKTVWIDEPPGKPDPRIV